MLISVNNDKLIKFENFEEINDLDSVFDQLKNLELLESSLKLDELDTLIEFNYLKAEYNFLLGAYEDAFSVFEEVKSLSIKPSHLKFYLLAQIGKAKIKLELGEYDAALTYLEESEHLYDKLDNSLISDVFEPAARLYFLKGEVYQRGGDLGSATLCFEKSMSFGNLIEDQALITDNLVSLGHIHRKQGDLTNASNYYLQALKYYRNLKKKQKVALALNNLGIVHRIRGELKLARDFLEQSVDLFKEFKDEKNITEPVENLGYITAIEGDLDKAYEMLLRTLEIRFRYGNSEEIARSYFYLLQIVIALDREKEIKHRMSEFKLLTRINKSNPIVQTYWLLSKALVLKYRGRLRDIVEAQTLLQQLLADGIINHELMIVATINLCEILIYELSYNEDETTFEEAKMLINSLLKIAQQQNSIILLIESLIVKSKFSFIEGDTDLANHILIQAKINAEEKGLGNYVEKIIEEQKELEIQISKWIEMSQQSSSIGEKIQETKLLDYVKDLYRI